MTNAYIAQYRIEKIPGWILNQCDGITFILEDTDSYCVTIVKLTQPVHGSVCHDIPFIFLSMFL